jgi:hypothetical protein
MKAANMNILDEFWHGKDYNTNFGKFYGRFVLLIFENVHSNCTYLES